MSSTLTTGRRLLVRKRKPFSQIGESDQAYVGQLRQQALPNGPSSTASACFSLANENGRPITLNSLTRFASVASRAP